MIKDLFSQELVWFPERGFGYYPVPDDREPYGADYFKKYEAYARTELGAELTEARLQFVWKHWTGQLCDVGIGSGQFARGAAMVLSGEASGYDINPVAVRWLCEQGLYRDPHTEPCDALTFWDSLEHLREPEGLISKAKHWVFVSLPIFEGPDHVLRSRHFRRDEHFWYFTESGFVQLMAEEGFDLRRRDDFETRLGRDGIVSFAFERATPLPRGRSLLVYRRKTEP